MNKMSWAETAKAMTEANEDWSEWDCTASDGLDEIPPHPITRLKGIVPKPAKPVSLKEMDRAISEIVVEDSLDEIWAKKAVKAFEVRMDKRFHSLENVRRDILGKRPRQNKEKMSNV